MWDLCKKKGKLNRKKCKFYKKIKIKLSQNSVKCTGESVK